MVKVGEFSPKDRIHHFAFGTGTIVEANERHTVIDFDEGGTRKFVTSMVKLTASDTPAPARTGRKKKAKSKSKAKAKTKAKG